MDDIIDQLVQFSCIAADDVYFHPDSNYITKAELTRRQIRAALQLLIDNELIEIRDRSLWPELVVYFGGH